MDIKIRDLINDCVNNKKNYDGTIDDFIYINIACSKNVVIKYNTIYIDRVAKADILNYIQSTFWDKYEAQYKSKYESIGDAINILYETNNLKLWYKEYKIENDRLLEKISGSYTANINFKEAIKAIIDNMLLQIKS
jgi:hypothetical protein